MERVTMQVVQDGQPFFLNGFDIFTQKWELSPGWHTEPDEINYEYTIYSIQQGAIKRTFSHRRKQGGYHVFLLSTLEIPGSHKILIADYETEERQNLADAFRALGQQVIEIASREKTFSVIESRQPELILLDVEYPSLAGIEILKQIRASSTAKGIPVLLLHRENPTDAEIFAGWKHGPDCSLVRPLIIEEMMSFVARILTNYSAEEKPATSEKRVFGLLAGGVTIRPSFYDPMTEEELKDWGY